MSRILLLTGPPGCGKTHLTESVLVPKIRDTCELPVAGFTTRERRDASGQRCGFELVPIDGLSVVFAEKRAPLPHEGRVGSYAVDLVALDAHVSNTGFGAGPRVVVLDEIGKMELLSPRFVEAVNAALADDEARLIVATVPVHRNPFVDRLKARADATVVEFSKGSREQGAREALEWLAAVAREGGLGPGGASHRGQASSPVKKTRRYKKAA